MAKLAAPDCVDSVVFSAPGGRSSVTAPAGPASTTRTSARRVIAPAAWYSGFGTMPVAEATRFVMLKNAATEAMSKMSRSENPASRNACRSASSTEALALVSLTAKSSMARCPGVIAATR